MTSRPLKVLHVCDHLGWEGSRMHGVKRLFAWMLPRFDPALVSPALISLRRRDLSEETLEDYLGNNIARLVGIETTRPPRNQEEAKVRLTDTYATVK